jgi:hypothetical protein
MHRLTQLQEVCDKGAPAQAKRARELLALLQSDPRDEPSVFEADALIEAYLHDPYLTKDAVDRSGA